MPECTTGGRIHFVHFVYKFYFNLAAVHFAGEGVDDITEGMTEIGIRGGHDLGALETDG